MSGSTAPVRQLATVAVSLSTVAHKCRNICSSVMSPIAFGEIRVSVNAKTFLEEPRDGWGITISGDPLPLKKCLEEIKADPESAAFLHKMLDSRLMLMIEAVKNKYTAEVTTATAVLADALEEISADLVSIEQAIQLKIKDTTAPGVLLRVSSASGQDTTEIIMNWSTKRKIIAEAHASYVETNAANDRLAEELRQATDDVQAKLIRERIKDNVRYMSLKRLHGLQAYGDSVTISESKEAYEKFPLPEKISGNNYDKFKEQVLAWCKRESTIMKYALIVYDIEYMVDMVDPQETAHELPPDVVMDGLNKEYDKLAKQGYPVDAELLNKRKALWATLYSELYHQATLPMQTWVTEMHSVGNTQSNIKVFKVEKHDGLRFVYAVLNAHIRFNDRDQHDHVTILRNLSNGFAKGGNVEQAIEDARRKLQEAKAVGVCPNYDQGGADCIFAMSQMHNDIWQAMLRGKYLHPDCKELPSFDAQDCTQVLSAAFKAALEIWKRTMQVEDKKGNGSKRKHTESTEEVTALKAGVKKTGMDLTKKVKQVIRETLDTIKKTTTIDQPAESYIWGYARDSEYFRSCDKREDQKTMIKACALMLTNGQELSEPALKAKVEKLRKGKGKGTGEKGKGKAKGKGKSKGKSHASHSESWSSAEETRTCKAKGCQERMSRDRWGKWFVTCREHSDQWRQEGVLTLKDGSQQAHWTWENPRESKKIKANKATIGSPTSQEMSFVNQDGTVSTEKLDPETVAFMMRAKQNNLRLQTDVPMADMVSFLLTN